MLGYGRIRNTDPVSFLNNYLNENIFSLLFNRINNENIEIDHKNQLRFVFINLKKLRMLYLHTNLYRTITGANHNFLTKTASYYTTHRDE